LSNPNFDFDSWVSQVGEWQTATRNVPALIHEDIIKSKIDFEDPKHGLKSLLVDPLQVQYALGYKDRKYSLTYDVLKRIPHQLGVVAAILQTRCNQAAAFSVPFRSSKSVGFMIKHRDPGHETTTSEKEKIQQLERFVYNCGAPDPNPHNKIERDDFETFLKKITRDSLMYDQACFEIVPDRRNQPYEFMAVDAATIRIASPNQILGIDGTYQERTPPISQTLLTQDQYAPFRAMQIFGQKNGERPEFIQLINGQIRNVYFKNELAFGVRNPRTDIYIQGYGYGEMEQLITILTAHLYAEEYNRRFFMQGSAPKGLLNFKGENFTPDQLEGFKRQWRANLEGVENCLAGDTKVYTKEHGFDTVQNICGDLEEVAATIWSGTAWETGLVYKTKAPKVLCHIETDNGLKFSCSPDHKVRTVDDAGDLVWKTQSSFKEGDFVLVNKNAVEAGTELLCFGKPVSNEMFEVLGWLIGDGHVGSRCLEWFYHHDKEQDILDKHLSIVQGYFPKATKVVTQRTSEQIEATKKRYGFKSVAGFTTKIQLNDVSAAQWAVAHGFYNTDQHRKQIPKNLYLCPTAAKNHFLKGLFSADGNNAKRRQPAITISNADIRQEVKDLLLSVGIRTCLSEGKHKLVIIGNKRSYEEKPSVLRIKDKTRFFDSVGFLQEHKQPSVGKKPNEVGKNDRLPRSVVCKFLAEVREANSKSQYTLLSRRERMDLNSIMSGADVCSKPRLLRYTTKANIAVPSWILDYHFAEVVEVHNTGLLVPMYDVSIDHEEHQFVGGNVLSSNSWKTPILQAEQGVEWIDLHPSNREMEYGQWVEYLIKITCAVFLMDPAELNFDLHGGVQQTPLFESSQEWKLKASRDRGLKPLLRFLAKLVNKNIISKIDDRFVFDFVGLDELTEQEKHQLRQEQVSSYMTLNEIRRAEDLPDVEDGDMILNPTYIQARQARFQQEQAKNTQEQAAPAGGAGGGAAAAPAQAEAPAPEQPNTAPKYAGSFKKSQEGMIELSLDAYKDLTRGV
jgi:hypothetical protein